MVEAVQDALQDAIDILVRKRDGRTVSFDRTRIEQAISAAFRAELGVPGDQALPPKITSDVGELTDAVLADVVADLREGDEAIEVERVQDKVEIQLMRAGHYSVGRRYIVYREDRTKARRLSGEVEMEDDAEAPKLRVLNPDGKREPLDASRIRTEIYAACEGLEACDPKDLLDEIYRSLYDDIKSDDIERAMILATRSRVEKDPAYGTVAMRLLLQVIYRHALGMKPTAIEVDQACRSRFRSFIEVGIEARRLDEKLLGYDLDKIARALKPERDQDFGYLGMQTIYDRYLLHVKERRIETPQYFWMRVAMGLAWDEGEERESRAI